MLSLITLLQSVCILLGLLIIVSIVSIYMHIKLEKEWKTQVKEWDKHVKELNKS